MSSELKKELEKVKMDFKNIKTMYRQIPNILTTSRILAIIPINILFFTGNISASFWISCIAFCTDWVDGSIARKLKIESKLGADLDALCDKLLIGGIAIPMIILNPVMIINVMLEGLISIPNIRAKIEGKEPKSSFVGKAKTWFLALTVLAGYIAALNNISLTLLQSLLAITPAVIMQTATLSGYINRNKCGCKKQKAKNEEHINIELEPKKEEKETQKEIMYSTATIEELKKLKAELITPYVEQNHCKTKSRFN